MDPSLDKSSKVINKIYDHLSYFDLYGGSLIFTIILTIIVLLAIGFANVMQHIAPIKDNWTEERCKPQNIPFAGFINKPDDATITDFTQDNFNYCTQTILQDVTKVALMPLNFITESLTMLYITIANSIQLIRVMIDSIRTSLKKIINDILDKTVNITIPLREITMSISDALGKTTGILVTKFYMIVGLFDIVKGVFSAITQALGILAIPPATAITIFAALLMFPFMIFPSIFLLIIMVLFGMGMYVENRFESEQVCFDKNTKLMMSNGSSKCIIDIQVGDKLTHDDIITEKFTLCAKNIDMYKLTDGTIASESHYIKYNNNWIKIKDYPDCEKINNYNESFIYCINTSSKRIIIGNNEYLDWDDIIDTTINKKQNSYNENTEISLFNGTQKIIIDIKIGDILSHGEKVFGLVESLDESNKSTKLYHLMTDKKSLYINNNKVCHYD
jgi:hypothetical protein